MGRQEGYVRIFNNNSWEKGGRLYSIGGGYQLLPLQQRVQMKINGESVYEIDIRASFLTIYHALVGEPLKSLEFPGEPLKDWEDPYARVTDVPRAGEAAGASSPFVICGPNLLRPLV